MKNNFIIKEILFLPVKFHTENISIYSLLKQSGYFEIYDDIQEIDILKALLKYPESIESWLLLSENKRTSSGWFFYQNENGKYVVDHFPTERDSENIEYTDIREACAFFIKRKIEDIRIS